MRKNRVKGTSLKIIALSDLIRLNNIIYTLFDQQEPEIKINHPHNLGTISMYFWKLLAL